MAAALLLAGCATAAPDPRAMRFPTLPLAPPAPRRVVLENGLVLHLLRDTEVPLVNVQVMVRTGAVLEPADKVDLAELAGRAMRTGGTARFRGEELNRRLEFLGATLETAIGRQSGTASLSVLSADLETGVELLAEVLRRPAFDPEEVERVKRRRIEEIRRSNDEPDGIAFREFRTLVYGADPRGRQPTPEMTGAITREELVAFHRSSFHPDRMLMGVSGDFDEESLLALVRRHFADWPRSGGPAPAFPLPGREVAPALGLASKELAQATIIAGHAAPPKESEDFFAFSVLDFIVGGAGFSSRLTEEIRSNRGLAYSVGSFYRAERGFGVFGAYCKTKTATAGEALGLLRALQERVQSEGVTERELRWAKDSMVNNLIFAVDGSREVIAQKLSFEYDGLPADFLERHRDRIEAVSAAEVLRVARAWLRPGAAATVVVGSGEELAAALAPYGPVTRINLRSY